MSLRKLSNSVYGRINAEPSLPSDSNKGYIVCDKYVVVVDTTYLLDDVRSDLEELRKITDRKVRYVINTHYHSDHTFGNCLFNCEIIAHVECRRLMKERRRIQLDELLQEVKDPKLRRQLQRLRPGYPTVVFEESYQIHSAPRIEVIHLGGHTPDLSVVYVPDESVLFASDNLFGSRDPSTPSHPYMAWNSDLNTWILALKRILGIEVKIIVPGHFGICNNQAASRLIDYLQLFMTNVRELKKQGYSKEEFKRRPELLNLPKLSVEAWIENNIETQYDRL